MTISSVTDLKSRAQGLSLGLYAADLGDLRNAAARAAEWGCGVLHFDEMDGNFVPGMIGGPGFVGSVGGRLLRDVHLLVAHPSRRVSAYVKAGADLITVHAEAPDAAEAICNIRQSATAAQRPVLAGLGLMPGTSIDDIGELLELAPDMILVLSLDPRDGSASDVHAACTRLHKLRRRCGAAGPVFAFDGGVTENTISEIAAAGADMIVSGSAVLKADDPARAFGIMREAWVERVGNAN